MSLSIKFCFTPTFDFIALSGDGMKVSTSSSIETRTLSPCSLKHAFPYPPLRSQNEGEMRFSSKYELSFLFLQRRTVYMRLAKAGGRR